MKTKRLNCSNCLAIFECQDNKRNENRKYCSGYCAKSANGKRNRGAKHSLDFCQNLSEINSGKGNPFYGKRHTEETKLLISKANTHSINKPIFLNEKQIDILNGLLLGDGHLDANKSSARYTQGCKHKEFLEHIMRLLPFGWCPIWHDKRWNCYHVKSHFAPNLREYWKKFYWNGKKIVPQDLQINREVLLYWFLSDGSIRFPHRNRFPNSLYFDIKLATDGFTRNENLLLVSKLKDIGIVSSLLNRNQIRIHSESKEYFLNLIGNTPVSCYKYKWRAYEMKGKKALVLGITGQVAKQGTRLIPSRAIARQGL